MPLLDSSNNPGCLPYSSVPRCGNSMLGPGGPCQTAGTQHAGPEPEPQASSNRKETLIIHCGGICGWRIRHINISGLGARTWTGRDPGRLYYDLRLQFFLIFFFFFPFCLFFVSTLSLGSCLFLSSARGSSVPIPLPHPVGFFLLSSSPRPAITRSSSLFAGLDH
ncbi:hypothetical protein BDV11DRAFT_58686 [Aspergillus similis]